MVTVIINGKKKEREFQNMSQALAFVYQNGECHGAEKLELVKAGVKKPEAQKPPAPTPPPVAPIEPPPNNEEE